MKTVGSRELKNRLGRYLKLVGKGETLIVTDRGKTVANIVPPASPAAGKPNTLESLLRRLEAEGHVRRAKRAPRNRRFKPIATSGKPASRMVIEDRE